VTRRQQGEPVGSDCRRRQGTQRQGQQGGVRGQRVALGGRQRHPDDAERDRGHGQHLARADWLGVVAGAGDEQEDEAGRQRRLHDGQRSEQERADVQTEAHDHDQAAGDPARPAEQARDQGQPHGVLARDHACLQRLQHQAGAEQHGGRHRGQGAEGEFFHPLPHPNLPCIGELSPADILRLITRHRGT